MVYVIFAAVIIGSYLIGSVNSSILLSKAIWGDDIRKSGSGNAGATNMLRTHGKLIGVFTLILDVLKGVIPTVIAWRLGMMLTGEKFSPAASSDFWNMVCTALPYIAGFFVVVGHNFPIFFGFKGGKGVATALGAILVYDWKTGLIILAAAILIMALTRYVSLGSVAAGVLFAVLEAVRMIYMSDRNFISLIFAFLMAFLVVFRHRTNIKRLLNGTERKLGQKAEVKDKPAKN